MKIGDFLKMGGSNPPATTKPISFKLLNPTAPDGQLTYVEARGVFVAISEKQRQEALRAAVTHMRKEYPDGDIPIARQTDEETYQILAQALRDEEDPRVQFSSADMLRACLSLPVARELFTAYNEFLKDEFPEYLSADDFNRLVEEAKGKSLAVLLSEFDYSLIRRALPGLSNLYGKP